MLGSKEFMKTLLVIISSAEKKKTKKHQHPAIIFHILDIFPKALIQDLFLSQYDLGGKTESQEQMCVCFFLLMKGFPIVLNYLICHHLWFLYSKRRNIITTTCIICRLLFWSFINFFCCCFNHNYFQNKINFKKSELILIINLIIA